MQIQLINMCLWYSINWHGFA